MQILNRLLICLLALYWISFTVQADEVSKDVKALQRLKQAVIKIHTTRAAPDYFTPWRLLNLEQTSGSGAVIKGKRIPTNAHVVADARYLQVQKHNDPKKYLANVEFVSHEADLAILSVEDATFFDGLNPLRIGKMPEPLTEVSVFGFPFGGQTLSITRGILSRVEHQRYAHAGSFLLAGQIDAAINPGNSGGPVIVDNRIVGVVMQANAGGRAENLGYFVPPPVINHVLKDAEDGQYHGVPALGFRTQGLEGPASKRAHGLSEDDNGILVTKVFEDSVLSGELLEQDILLSINGYQIADDQTIKLDEDLRSNFKFIVDNMHPGDELNLVVSRNGETVKIQSAAELNSANRSLVLGPQYDQRPRYLVYGGVVFVPLNMNLIKRWGRDWHNQAPVEFLYSRGVWSTPQRQELIVALKVLAADVNLGYHNWSNWIIHSINGEPVKNFNDFAQTLRNFSGDFVHIADDQGYQMIIDHDEALKTESEIEELYGLPASFSEGLFENVAVQD
ncbi:S1C family serine protease [Sessilibacter corallicola]|uniref:S1C family serine protease n=1 Tax=Sessilibacter corallicola TaxID=2904075 RepID=A0ABQ0A6Y9_9GAMM